MIALIKKKIWLKMCTCYLGGTLLCLTLPPFNITVLTPLIFTGFLLLLLHTTSSRHAFFMGFFLGFGYFTASLYWINNALMLDSLFYWLILPSIFLLPGYLAIYIAFPAILTWKMRFKSRYVLCLTWATTLTFGEILRGYLFSGFPWNTFGLALTNSLPFLQITSIVGVYGLSFIFSLLSSSFILLYGPSKQPKTFISILVASLCIWSAGAYRLYQHPTQLTSVPITLVQPNIKQLPFWSNKQKLDNLLETLQLSSSVRLNEPNIIIWPESSVPFVFNYIPILEKSLRSSLSANSVLIFGTTRVEYINHQIKPFNSLYILTQKKGVEGYYDKNHLLPFGEYIPFSSLMEKYFSINSLTGGGIDFSFGRGPKTFVLPFNLPTFSPSICYEAIFPGVQIPKKSRPMWMVNITNDAWFGNSIGPYQHLQMSRLRAIEEGIPLVRVATTGISGVIDPYGRILELIPLNKKAALTTYLPKNIKVAPPFSKYKHQLLFLFLVIIWLFPFMNANLRKR